MKTKRYALLMLCSSLLFANQLFAQNDYVVTLAGDTVKGKIKKTLFGALRFKAEGKSENADLTTSNFKEYFNSKDSTYYVALTVAKQARPEFLERLENGKIKLFKLVVSYPGAMGPGGMMAGGGSTVTWYASKDNGGLLEIKTNGLLTGARSEREKNFDSLIGSYPELLEDFKKEKSFSFDMLRAYIKKYNYYYKYVVKS